MVGNQIRGATRRKARLSMHVKVVIGRNLPSGTERTWYHPDYVATSKECIYLVEFRSLHLLQLQCDDF